jgi:hypothetical protein
MSSKVEGKKVIVGIPCCTCFGKFFNKVPQDNQSLLSSYERTYHVNDLTEAEFVRLYYKFKPFLEKNLSINISLLEQNYDLRTVINRILSQITLFQINLITLDIFEDMELIHFLQYLIDTYPRR